MGKEENSLSAFLPLFGLVSEYFDSYALPAIIHIKAPLKNSIIDCYGFFKASQ
jgi:hypothetical protein